MSPFSAVTGREVVADDSGNVWFDERAGVWVYRASGLGNCIRALVGARRGMTALPWPEDFKARFADGNLHEGAVKQALRDAGLRVDHEQDTCVLPVMSGAEIRGHTDGVVMGSLGAFNFAGVTLPPEAEGCVGADGFLRVVLEVKAFADSGWKKFDRNGLDDYPYYAIQLSVYMAAYGLPGLMAVKNKNNGKMAWRFYAEPPVPIAELRKRVAQVEAAVLTSDLPACDKPNWPCLYAYLHEDVAEKGHEDVAEEEVAMDAPSELAMSVAVWAAEYDDARTAESNAKRLKDQARVKLLELIGKGKVDTEDWAVSVTDNAARFNKARMMEDFPDLPWDSYMDPGEGQQVRVTKHKKRKETT